MKKSLIRLCILISVTVLGQRKLPNPIILVHGYTGSYETWTDFTNYLQSEANLTIAGNYLNFNLDCDNSKYSSYLYSDVCDYTVGAIGNNDVYVVNFRVGISGNSNQSGVVKQGFALKLAISKVLAATGADKVMLLGHSMGGLAIREYLQNPSNWQNDGQHHIAKVSTIGTPHRGSNISVWNISGFDENSESVRDLRESYFYSNCTRNGQSIACPGVYLWGGQETRTWMRTNALGGSNFYNIDVNSNNKTGEDITGLNRKSINTGLDFSCIIGGPNNSDGIVSTYSQDLNNVFSSLEIDKFYFNCNGALDCHTVQPKRAFKEMIHSLDEPKKYPTILKFGNLNRGFFTSQSNGGNIDLDEYTFYAPQRGVVSLIATNLASSNGRLSIYDQSNNLLFNQPIENSSVKTVQVPYAGNYKISISGSSLGSWATYSVYLGFCELPNMPFITSIGALNFCEGEVLKLSTNIGYENYVWFKDGIQLENKSSEIEIGTSGSYSVQAFKCGIVSNSLNSIKTVVKPKPIKPTIVLDERPDQFLLTSSSPENNQWFLDGNTINEAINQTFIPNKLGTYYVKITKDGCSNISEPSIVKIDKPILKVIGSNIFCEGDSSKLVAPIGFGSYIYSDGSKQIETKKNEFIVKSGAKYTVITNRGVFVSVKSDSIEIIVNKKPAIPSLSIDSQGLKSSSASNNQWLLNGIPIKDSTNQFITNYSSGSYSVQVEENGCISTSDTFVITGIESNEINLKLFPNPNYGEFSILLPYEISQNWKIEIINLKGERVYNRDVKVVKDEEYKIVLNVNDGVYILKASSKNRMKIIKFLVN